MSFTTWLVLVGILLVILWAWVILDAFLGGAEESSVTSRSPDQRKQEQILLARYGRSGDPLLEDHAATSLVIRSSSRGRRQ